MSYLDKELTWYALEAYISSTIQPQSVTDSIMKTIWHISIIKIDDYCLKHLILSESKITLNVFTTTDTTCKNHYFNFYEIAIQE